MSQLKGTEKKFTHESCQLMDIKGGNHFRKGSIVNNVKENEGGGNSTGLGEVITEKPGLRES